MICIFINQRKQVTNRKSQFKNIELKKSKFALTLSGKQQL